MTIGNRLKLAGLFMLVVGAAACGGGNSNPAAPSVNVPYSQTDLRAGTGAEATAGKRATVHYTLWLYSTTGADNKGQLVQTSAGTAGFTFTVGAGDVIRGWDQGVPGMKVGGLRRLVIPPSLGYGGQANGPIPANSTLVFEIELLAIQ